MEKEGIECDKKTSEIDPNKKSSKSGIGKSRKGKCQDSEDRSKAANQDIRTMMERNRRSANELKEARAKKEGQDVAGQQKLTHSLQRAGEQKLTNKEEDTLLYNHLVFWEREECMMEGSGMEMEWENTCITLVMGYGCDNDRKRIHGKKQRWTNQAKDMARMAGKVPRMIKRAGRRLEGERRRERLEIGMRKRADLLDRLKTKKDKIRTALDKQRVWKVTHQFSKLNIAETMVHFGTECPRVGQVAPRLVTSAPHRLQDLVWYRLETMLPVMHDEQQKKLELEWDTEEVKYRLGQMDLGDEVEAMELGTHKQTVPKYGLGQIDSEKHVEDIDELKYRLGQIDLGDGVGAMEFVTCKQTILRYGMDQIVPAWDKEQNEWIDRLVATHVRDLPPERIEKWFNFGEELLEHVMLAGLVAELSGLPGHEKKAQCLQNFMAVESAIRAPFFQLETNIKILAGEGEPWLATQEDQVIGLKSILVDQTKKQKQAEELQVIDMDNSTCAGLQSQPSCVGGAMAGKVKEQVERLKYIQKGVVVMKKKATNIPRKNKLLEDSKIVSNLLSRFEEEGGNEISRAGTIAHDSVVGLSVRNKHNVQVMSEKQMPVSKVRKVVVKPRRGWKGKERVSVSRIDDLMLKFGNKTQVDSKRKVQEDQHMTTNKRSKFEIVE